MKKIAGFCISIILLGILFYNIDFNELLKFKDRIRPIEFVYFCIFSGFSFVLFGIRWHLFLEKKVSILDSILLTFIGQGGNAIFPARAGDFIRVYQTSKESKETYPSTFLKLIIEKFFDLFFAFTIGQIALWMVDSKNNLISENIRFSVLFFFIISILSVFFFKYGKETILSFLKKVFYKINMKNFFEEKIVSYADKLLKHLSFSYLCFPFILSIFIWFIFYFAKFYFLSRTIGLEFSYFEVLFLVFCGAMAFMIPSAPSGAGVVHASIVTGCLILGKSKIDGIAYGFIVHLGSFLFQGFAGLVCYFIWNLIKGDQTLILKKIET